MIQLSAIPMGSNSYLQEYPWPTDHPERLLHREWSGNCHDHVHRAIRQRYRLCRTCKEGDVLHAVVPSRLLCHRTHGCLRLDANDLGRIPRQRKRRLPTTRADVGTVLPTTSNRSLTTWSILG